MASQSKETKQIERLRQALFEELETRTFEEIPTRELLKMLATINTSETRLATAKAKTEKKPEDMNLEEMKEFMKTLQ